MVLYAWDYFATMQQEEYTKILLQLPRPARNQMLEGIESRVREDWARTEEDEAVPAPAT